VVTTVEVATTDAPAAIDLSADRSTIAADRRDVAHITVRIVDAKGTTVPTADNEVVFDVAGEGRLIGLDNGDMRSHEDYKGRTRRAYNGMCLAILQSTARTDTGVCNFSRPKTGRHHRSDRWLIPRRHFLWWDGPGQTALKRSGGDAAEPQRAR
jgi:beta-galactosidase